MNETTEQIMKQLNQKKTHAVTHELGGGDEIDATKLKNIGSVVAKTISDPITGSMMAPGTVGAEQIDPDLITHVADFSVLKKMYTPNPNTKLLKWRTALSKIQAEESGIINLNFIGDSITEGQAEIEKEELWKYGYVGVVREYFKNIFEDVGRGMFDQQSFQWSPIWTYSSSTNWQQVAGFGIRKVRQATMPGDFATLNFNGSGVNIQYLAMSNAGNVDIYIDSVLIKTINTYSASMTFLQDVITGLEFGDHLLKIVNKESYFYLVGAYETKGVQGVRVNQYGFGGSELLDVTVSENTLYPIIDLANPTITFIGYLFNDFNRQTSVATYKNRLTTLVQRAMTKGDCVLLTLGLSTTTHVIPLTDYYNAMCEVATEQNCELIDVYKIWGSDGQKALDMGLLFLDGIHPSRVGQRNIANIIINALG